LHAALLPAEATEWDGIRETVEQAAPLVKSGRIQLRNLYLLDASMLTLPSDTQFFCSNATGSLTVTVSMRALPPGRYAVVLADAAGAALSGQIGLVLAWGGAGADTGWKLAGVSVRAGTFGGHDGVWYWTHARDLARSNQPWSAWYSYDVARYLLLPVDFLSSPNMEKLTQEQSLVKSATGNSLQDAFPLNLAAGDRTWKIESVRLEPSLNEPDLGVTFASTGVTDPAAQRTEAVAVLSALLKAQPALRENFHGLWAIAEKDGKKTPVMELPMAQIP
jgi:hypothetical protein